MINFKGKWIVVFCIAVFLWACNVEDEQGVTEIIGLDICDEMIMQAAQEDLERWLAAIPEGMEQRYGFSNRAEFASAQIDKPVRMYGFKSETKPEDSPILAHNQWRVPVTVDGSYRTMLTVQATEDEITAVGIGGAGLAKEIGEIRQTGLAAKGILRVHTLSSDFIIDSSKLRIEPNLFTFVLPMQSAQQYLGLPAYPLHIKIVIMEINLANAVTGCNL